MDLLTGLETLFVVAAVSAASPIIAVLLPGQRIPQLILLILGGVIIGPQVLGLGVTLEIELIANVGLGLVFLLAGFEIDLQRIKGHPLVQACIGWLLSLAIAFGIAVFLVSSGFALNSLVIGLVLTTTALGTLLPMLRDADILTTRFGSFMLAIGTVGEFGPVVAIAVLLSGDNPIDGSSSMSSLGRLIIARPMASICCSPPENVPAAWLLRSPRIGNRS